MTSMNIVQFSRPPNPIVHLHPKLFDPLDLGRPTSNEFPLSKSNQLTLSTPGYLETNGT